MTAERGRVRVFAELGFPFDKGYEYDWDGVRPSDGAVLLQVSTLEAFSGWPNAIPILDADEDAKGRYPGQSLNRHYKRRDNVERVRDGSAPAFIILAIMNRRGTKRERTRSIDRHQTYRVLEFFNAEYNGHPDAVFAKVATESAYNGVELK